MEKLNDIISSQSFFFSYVLRWIFYELIILHLILKCFYFFIFFSLRVYSRSKRPFEKFNSKTAMINETYSISSSSSSGSNGDRRLAQSAQMYHYQHQKQQMLALEKENEEKKGISDNSENEEDDYTIYECPGLAKVWIFLSF